MIVFYQPRKSSLPVLAAPQDLLLLEQIQKYQPTDKQSSKRQKRLIHGFHQVNSMCMSGALIGFFLAIVFLYLLSDDFLSVTPHTKYSVIVIIANLAIVPFCYYLRILGIRSIRKQFEKTDK